MRLFLAPFLVLFLLPSVSVASESEYKEKLRTTAMGENPSDAMAQVLHGQMYEHGSYGTKQSFAEAMKWYLRAADQGYADGMFRIGALYENGQGVKQDYAEAMKWFRKAAEQENYDALYSIGMMYEYGWGVSQNWQEAYFWERLTLDEFQPDPPENHLTTEQKSAVEKRIKEWQKAHPVRAAVAPLPKP